MIVTNRASQTMTIIHTAPVPRCIAALVLLHWSSLPRRILFFPVCLLQTLNRRRRQAAEFTSYCRGTAEQAKQILGRSHDEFVSSLDIIRQSIWGFCQRHQLVRCRFGETWQWTWNQICTTSIGDRSRIIGILKVFKGAQRDRGWLGLRHSLLTVHSFWSDPRQFAAVCTETIRCIRLELTTNQPGTWNGYKCHPYWLMTTTTEISHRNLVYDIWICRAIGDRKHTGLSSDSEALTPTGIEPAASDWQDSALPTTPPDHPEHKHSFFFYLNCSRDDKIKILILPQNFLNPPQNEIELRLENEFYPENDHPEQRKWKVKTNKWDYSRNAGKIGCHGRKDWRTYNLFCKNWSYDYVDDYYYISNVTVDWTSTQTTI